MQSISDPHQLQSNFWFEGEGSDYSQASAAHQLQPNFWFWEGVTAVKNL